MSDEKIMVATNALNKLREINLGEKFKKQIEKRDGAPIPSDDQLEQHLSKVVAPNSTTPAAVANSVAQGGAEAFFDLWDEYYPRVVSLLGWASWVIPGKQLTIIKSLLAVVNSLMPELRKLLT